MPNGSLDMYIHKQEQGNASISYEKIHNIAIGVARGIEYLHEGYRKMLEGEAVVHQPENLFTNLHGYVMILREDPFWRNLQRRTYRNGGICKSFYCFVKTTESSAKEFLRQRILLIWQESISVIISWGETERRLSYKQEFTYSWNSHAQAEEATSKQIDEVVSESALSPSSEFELVCL
ncbi:hypothetical protein AHAS_Ahas02G0092400 [Arachis hypogaea]